MALTRFIILSLVAVLTFTGAASARAFDFSLWDDILKDHVSQTSKDGVELAGFDYDALSGDKRFNQIVSKLHDYQPAFTNVKENISFWSNVYNIFAAKMVIANRGVKSIRDAGSFFSSVWVKDAGAIGGKTYSLDDIEHKILRPLGDPRIHAAIVCASVSCPDIRREAYDQERLDIQLDQQWRGFLDNRSKGFRIDRKNKKIYLSKIFKWFHEDFDAKGGVRTFIASYKSPDTGAFIKNKENEILYMDYNWALNSVK
ncbi:hypothetical protein MNBD_NITROSPINAE02-1845 [hydrothermal vent metagenome]|uniref:DUF547 domain-containing protein n=1 Tax=hydrothermal vent metagenome TaxID=652676 RepID=A0A3B1CFQ2_9ZZZZ